MANWRITNTFFTGLINRLGIRPPPRDGFAISDIVTPVSLVDADISLSAVATTPLFDLGQLFSAGEQIAPIANTRLANTGAQPAGNYTAVLIVGLSNAGDTNSIRIRRRNAADAGDVWTLRFGIAFGAGAGLAHFFLSLRVTLADQERMVIENVAAGAAATVYQGTIILVAS